MNNTQYDYPFDPAGTASTNLVLGDRQLINPPNWRDFYIVIPRAAPFFREGLVVRHLPSNRVLVEGVDYILTHAFHSASLATAKPIYGSLLLKNRELTGALDMDYQTLGDKWTLNSTTITEILAGQLADPRVTVFEQIVEMPAMFPVIDHQWHLDDLVGASEIVEGLQGIEDAILAGAGNSGTNVTAESLGLGAFVNMTVASQPQAMDAHHSTSLITPEMLHLVLNTTVGQELLDHINATGNVHGLQAADLNLELVPNYPAASPQDVVAGTNGQLLVTPTGVAAALQAFYDNYLRPHLEAGGRAHDTTKADVGLSETPNWGPATPQIAIQGTSNAHVISPATMRAAVDAWIGDALNDHFNAVNPHGITKEIIQLGNVVNLGLATVQQARDGSTDAGLLTPRLGYELFMSLFNQYIGGGGNGGTGPTTPIDAYTRAETDQLLEMRLGSNATAVDSARLGGKTAAEWIADTTFRHYVPAAESSTTNWTRVASFDPPSSSDAERAGDLILLLAGGDVVEDNNTPLFTVALNVWDSINLSAHQIAGRYAPLQLGYVQDPDTARVDIYVKGPAYRNPLATLVVSDPFGRSKMTNDVTETEPAGIVYEVSYTYNSVESAVSLRPGDVAFGHNPYVEEGTDFGMLIEKINVARTSAEVTTAGTTPSEISQAWRNFIPTSGQGQNGTNAVVGDLRAWGWDGAESAIISPQVGTSRIALVSDVQYQNYSFEVELSGGADDKFIGVCIAHVVKDGRDYGLYVMRTPGGGVNDDYGLITTVINPFQDDEVIISKSNEALVWGDGVLNENRTNTYFPNSGNWDVAGPVRLRVTRNGSMFTIQTTQHNSTDYATGRAYILSINTSPYLAAFADRAGWGLMKYAQPDARFKVLNRPDRWVPYITKSEDQYGQDTSSINRFNGSSWVNEPMSINSPFGMPGRLIYCQMTKKLYTTRRDGSIEQLDIVPNVEGNPTFAVV